MKPLKDTKLGKLLASKGLNTVLDTVGTFIPGVKILDNLKDSVLGNNTIPEQDKTAIIEEIKVMKELLELQMQDTANARAREIEIAKTGKQDYMMVITGCIGLATFIFMVIVIAFFEIPPKNERLFDLLLGGVIGTTGSIFAYYFGSSKGSKDKTDILKEVASQ
ncbi:MAG TPA: hypothetical protein VJY62_07280 [Bacteroidia bacterium]|nr:hypothetical protein [Bacteroidia bacterium]